MRMDELKGRVAGDGYVVDAGAVAEAMLRRSAVRRLLNAPPPGGARNPGARAPRRQG